MVEMIGPLFCDIFMSERLLLCPVGLKILLNRSSQEFCLMASEDGADFRGKLIDVSRKLRKIKVSPTITAAHEIKLKNGPAIYPVRRVECKSFIIAAGNPALGEDNVFNGLVQKSLVFGLVRSDAFNGTYKRNPFNF